MPTFNQTISVRANDSYDEAGGAWYEDGWNFDLYAGIYNGNVETAGFRFTGVTIPQGATINSATLTIWVTNSTGSGLIGTYCEAADNSAIFSDVSRPGSRTKTAGVRNTGITAFTTGAQNVIDVSVPLQEVINRSGFASGNAVSFLLTENGIGSGSNDIGIEDFADTTHNYDATLNVDYSSGPQTVTLTAALDSPLHEFSANATVIGTGPITLTAALNSPLHEFSGVIVENSISNVESLEFTTTAGDRTVTLSGMTLQTPIHQFSANANVNYTPQTINLTVELTAPLPTFQGFASISSPPVTTVRPFTAIMRRTLGPSGRRLRSS